MSIIRAVTGDIAPDQLGLTLSHEHLLWEVPALYREDDPDLGLDSLGAAESELRRFRSSGGCALVEMTTPELRRDPAGLQALSERTGVYIISATGHNKAKFADGWNAGKSVDEIAAAMIGDITRGMDGTTIRAGVIKASTSKDGASEGERRVIQAAGLAHRATGAPVSTHTEAGTFALEQIRLLQESGVPPERMLIGHLDRGLRPDLYLEIARTGVYMGLDQIGKEKYWPDAERAGLVARLVQAGYGERLLFSGDMARKSNWPSYGANFGPGLTCIIEKFTRLLAAAGVDEAAVRSILVENPRRFFAFGG
jgi:phosphotriesterase-related protein